MKKVDVYISSLHFSSKYFVTAFSQTKSIIPFFIFIRYSRKLQFKLLLLSPSFSFSPHTVFFYTRIACCSSMYYASKWPKSLSDKNTCKVNWWLLFLSTFQPLRLKKNYWLIFMCRKISASCWLLITWGLLRCTILLYTTVSKGLVYKYCTV